MKNILLFLSFYFLLTGCTSNGEMILKDEDKYVFSKPLSKIEEDNKRRSRGENPAILINRNKFERMERHNDVFSSNY